MSALRDLLELGARARIRTPVLSSQCWILLIKWHLIITIMRSCLLFNYILLVAANPQCGNPSTCFLRLAGTQRFVSCLASDVYHLHLAWHQPFPAVAPEKLSSQARPCSEQWHCQHSPPRSDIQMWVSVCKPVGFLKGCSHQGSEADTGSRLLGLQPVCLLQRCCFLGCKPGGGSLLQGGLDMMGSGFLSSSPWLFTRDTVCLHYIKSHLLRVRRCYLWENLLLLVLVVLWQSQGSFYYT